MLKIECDVTKSYPTDFKSPAYENQNECDLEKVVSDILNDFGLKPQGEQLKISTAKAKVLEQPDFSPLATTLSYSFQNKWNTSKDIEMFKIFKAKIAELSLDIDEFRGVPKLVAKKYKFVLRYIVDTTGWKGNTKSILVRIQKLMKSTDFSAREVRRLKRCLRRYEKSQNNPSTPFTMEQLLEQFPGKTEENVHNFIKSWRPLKMNDW